MWFVFALHDLIAFMVYWAITYSEPFQATPLLRRFRSSHRRFSVKKGAVRNFAKLTGKDLCQSLFFHKFAGPSPVALLKKRLWHGLFCVNFAKFLRTPFLQNTSSRLLLTFERVLNTLLLNVK